MINKFSEIISLIEQGFSIKDRVIILLYFMSRPFRKIGLEKPSVMITNVTVKNRDGIFFCGNNISSVRSASPSTEENLRKFFNLKTGIFVDVGAAIGKYTVIMGKKLGKNGIVVSIEPENSNFQILKENVRLNDLKNVLLENCACSSKNGFKRFFLDAIGTGAHSFYKNKVISKRSIKMRVKKLDSILFGLIKNLKKKNMMIKLDVEGAEAEVLRGSINILRKIHPVIIFESWDDKNLTKIGNILKRFNYKIKRVDKENYFAY